MEPRPKTSTVRIPRGVLIALGGALLVSLAALAFLVGRQSAHKEPPSPPPAVAAAAPVPAEAPDEGAATVEPPSPVETPAVEIAPIEPGETPEAGGWTLPQPTATLATPPPEAAPSAPAPTPDTSFRDEVARYFEEAESIQSRAKYWSDPQALAKALMDQAGKGDSSGFDKLIDANRRVRDELRGLHVPAPCAEHHRLTQGLVEEGLSLLEGVRGSALNPSQDTSALNAFATAGRELEARAKEVDALGARIKQQFGIGG